VRAYHGRFEEQPRQKCVLKPREPVAFLPARLQHRLAARGGAWAKVRPEEAALERLHATAAQKHADAIIHQPCHKYAHAAS
jgi:hypothetical protein